MPLAPSNFFPTFLSPSINHLIPISIKLGPYSICYAVTNQNPIMCTYDGTEGGEPTEPKFFHTRNFCARNWWTSFDELWLGNRDKSQPVMISTGRYQRPRPGLAVSMGLGRVRGPLSRICHYHVYWEILSNPHNAKYPLLPDQRQLDYNPTCIEKEIITDF